MSSFWVHYLDCSFKCSKRTFDKISKEFKELYDRLCFKTTKIKTEQNQRHSSFEKAEGPCCIEF